MERERGGGRGQVQFPRGKKEDVIYYYCEKKGKSCKRVNGRGGGGGGKGEIHVLSWRGGRGKRQFLCWTRARKVRKAWVRKKKGGGKKKPPSILV